MKSVFSFLAGFASGWAVRSVADSPQGVGVKAIEVAQRTRARVEQWASVEYERLADMCAQAAQSGASSQDNGKGAHGLRAVKQEPVCEP